jgi:hypothetical protein
VPSKSKGIKSMMNERKLRAIQELYVWLGYAFATAFVSLVIYPILIAVPPSALHISDLTRNAGSLVLLSPLISIFIISTGRLLGFSLILLSNHTYSYLGPSRVLNFLMYGYALGRIRSQLSNDRFNMIGDIRRTPTRLALSSLVIAFIGIVSIDAILQLVMRTEFVAPVTINSFQGFLKVSLVLIIIFPLIESLIMLLTMESAIRHLRLKSEYAVFISATGWAALHAIGNHPIQTISIFWLFFILGKLYIELRARTSLPGVFAGITITHSASNLFALLLIVLRQTASGI